MAKVVEGKDVSNCHEDETIIKTVKEQTAQKRNADASTILKAVVNAHPTKLDPIAPVVAVQAVTTKINTTKGNAGESNIVKNWCKTRAKTNQQSKSREIVCVDDQDKQHTRLFFMGSSMA